MKRYLLIVLLITMIVCSSGSACASAFSDTVAFFDSNSSLEFRISAEFVKLPQFSKERTDLLNRLMKHFSFHGTVEDQQSEVSVVLDDRELFSCLQLNLSGKPVSVIAPDRHHFYIMPDTNEFQSDFMFSDLNNDLDNLLRNIMIYKALDPLSSFIGRLPSFFPDKTKSEKIQTQTFRDYGKAIRKTTLAMAGEDLAKCIHEYSDLFLPENLASAITSVFFEGRQSVTLYLTADDSVIMAAYSGHAGITEDDPRSVRLNWNTVRNGSFQKDEIQLRTPNSKGTERNNLLLTYTWKKDAEERETVQWTAETDVVNSGVRTRTFCDASLSFSDNRVEGDLNCRTVRNNKTESTTGCIEASVPADGHCAGTLEICHKKDKIEKDRLLIRFDLSRNNNMLVSSIQPETETADERTRTEIIEKLSVRIVQELLKLPDEDIALLSEGIPDDLWETILSGRID